MTIADMKEKYITQFDEAKALKRSLFNSDDEDGKAIYRDACVRYNHAEWMLARIQKVETDLEYFQDTPAEDSEFTEWYIEEAEKCVIESENCERECLTEGWCPLCINLELFQIYETRAGKDMKTLLEELDPDFDFYV